MRATRMGDEVGLTARGGKRRRRASALLNALRAARWASNERGVHCPSHERETWAALGETKDGRRLRNPVMFSLRPSPYQRSRSRWRAPRCPSPPSRSASAGCFFLEASASRQLCFSCAVSRTTYGGASTGKDPRAMTMTRISAPSRACRGQTSHHRVPRCRVGRPVQHLGRQANAAAAGNNNTKQILVLPFKKQKDVCTFVRLDRRIFSECNSPRVQSVHEENDSPTRV